MVRQPPIIAKRDVFLLPLFVETFAAALVQVTLLERNSSAATKLTGGQAPILVILFGRIKQVGPSPGFPGGSRRGTWRGQVLAWHRQPDSRANASTDSTTYSTAVERGFRRHIIVVQSYGQFERLPVQRRRQVRPKHRFFE